MSNGEITLASTTTKELYDIIEAMGSIVTYKEYVPDNPQQLNIMLIATSGQLNVCRVNEAGGIMDAVATVPMKLGNLYQWVMSLSFNEYFELKEYETGLILDLCKAVLTKYAMRNSDIKEWYKFLKNTRTTNKM